jgi:hypothetical protein
MKTKGFAMKKFLLAATVAVAASMMLPLTASAAVTTSNNDSADGTGSAPVYVMSGFPSNPVGAASVHFSSQANFNGTEPRGSMRADLGPDTFNGDVTCVIVNGNTAIVGGYIDHALGAETFGGLPANTFSLKVVDNGNSSDALELDIGPSPLDDFCGEGTFFGPMTTANVSVHDG